MSGRFGAGSLRARALVVGVSLLSLAIVGMAGAYVGLKHPHWLYFVKGLAQVYINDMLVRGDFSALQTASNLPVFDLNIRFKHLRRLEELRRGVVSQEPFPISGKHKDEWFPADIRAEGKEIRVKVRLKGDSVPHYWAPRYSLSVKTRDGAVFEGMRRFSIQNREYSGRSHSTIIFSEHLRDYGLLTPKVFPVRYQRNGEDLGLMLVEELPTKFLLERYGRREGPIFQFEEDNLVGLKRKSIAVDYSLDHYSRNFQPLFQNQLLKKQAMSDVASFAERVMRDFVDDRIGASQAFDLRQWADFVILSEVWGATHGLGWSNLRMYFNPVTLKFEPVVWDSRPGYRGVFNADVTFNKRCLFDSDNFIHWLTRSPEMQQAMKSSARRVLLEVDSETFVQKFGERDRELRQLLAVMPLRHRYFPNPLPIGAVVEKARVVARLIENDAFDEIVPSDSRQVAEVIRDFIAGQYVFDGGQLELKVKNLLRSPVGIIGVSIESGEETATHHGIPMPTPLVLPAFIGIGSEFQTLIIDASSVDGAIGVLRLLVRTPWNGQVQEIVVPPSLMAEGGHPYDGTDAANLLKLFPFLRHGGDSSSLYVRPGDWRVDSPLVLRPGLSLSMPQGVVLEFSENAKLVVQGPLSIAGTASHPVILKGQAGDAWGGVAVLASGATVNIAHTQIRDVTRSALAKDFIDAAMVIHDGDVQIDGLSITNVQAEDALNLFACRFDVRALDIQNTTSDALDIDFSAGTIDGFKTRGNGGDGLDLSGTKLRASNIDAFDIYDKGISIGEGSHADITGVKVANAGIAVVSKDLSVTKIKNIFLTNILYSAMMAYRKKQEYGPGVLHVEGVTKTGVETLATSQLGSAITIDGQSVDSVDLDVDNLYKTGNVKR